MGYASLKKWASAASRAKATPSLWSNKLTADLTRMAAYRRAVDQLGGHFAGYDLIHVDRRKNEEADELSRIGSRRENPPPDVFPDKIYNPSIKPPKQIDIAIPDAPDVVHAMAIIVVPEWTDPYMEYLLHQKLPDNEVEA